MQIAPQGAAKTLSEFFRTGIIAMLSEIGAATSNLSRPSQGQGGNIIRVDGQKPWAQTTQTILGILSDGGAIGAVPFDIEV